MSSLIDIGKLSEPATKLIEKVSDAIGILYEPTRMLKEAKAEMKIEELKMAHKLKISKLQKRAIDRFLHVETVKQANIEQVVSKAIPKLKEGANPERINSDWLFYLMENCKFSSDDEIQELWAEILSGEANSPGTVSKMTINILSSMESHEAKMFHDLTGVVWEFEEVPPTSIPVLINPKDNFYIKKGLSFTELSLLSDVGLINFAPGLTTGYIVTSEGESIIGSYNGKKYKFYFRKDETGLSVSHIIFSKAGSELYSVIPKKSYNDFEDYVFRIWKESGIRIEKVI